MKLLAVVFLSVAIAYTAAGSDKEWQMFKHWTYMKAQESCWGEENMKKHTVDMKKAVAKCQRVDAPELNLPPFRSTYRFINTLLTKADEMENNKLMYAIKMMDNMGSYHNNQYESFRPFSSNYESHHSNNNNNWMEKMMKMMMMKKMMASFDNMDNDHSGSSYHHSNKYSTYSKPNSYSSYDADSMQDDLMKSMMEYKMKHMADSADSKARFNFDEQDNYGSDYRQKMMQLLSRSKRQANKNKDAATTLPISLDIGDRLTEKVQAEQAKKEQEIGNFTCVMRECGMLNANNELDARTQKEYFKKFDIKNKWLKNRVMDDIDTCVEVAKSLPEDYMEEYNYKGYANMAQIKTYMKCIKYSKMRTCMYKDVKEKLETNFGDLESILEQTQMTENQLFPLVINLLHGDEMEFGY